MLTPTAPDWSGPGLLTVDVQNDTLAGQALEIPGMSEMLPALRVKWMSGRSARRKAAARRRLLLATDATSGLVDRGSSQMANIGVGLLTVDQIVVELEACVRRDNGPLRGASPVDA